MKRRIVSILLCVCLFLSLGANALATDTAAMEDVVADVHTYFGSFDTDGDWLVDWSKVDWKDSAKQAYSIAKNVYYLTEDSIKAVIKELGVVEYVTEYLKAFVADLDIDPQLLSKAIKVDKAALGNVVSVDEQSMVAAVSIDESALEEAVDVEIDEQKLIEALGIDPATVDTTKIDKDALAKAISITVDKAELTKAVSFDKQALLAAIDIDEDSLVSAINIDKKLLTETMYNQVMAKVKTIPWKEEIKNFVNGLDLNELKAFIKTLDVYKDYWNEDSVIYRVLHGIDVADTSLKVWGTGNYTLSEDITLDEPVYIEGIVNLNLNGHTISGDADALITVDKNAILNVYDFSREQSGAIDMGSASLVNNGTVTLFSGRIYGQNGIINNGQVNVCAGELSGDDYGVYNNGVLVVTAMPEINGEKAGIYVAEDAKIAVGSWGLWNDYTYTVETEEEPTEENPIAISDPCEFDFSKYFSSAVEGRKVFGKETEDGYVVMVGCGEQEPGPDDELPFTDINKEFYDAVKFAYKSGLMIGTSATTFSPYEALTRGMVVTILYRMFDEPDVEITERFTDVEAGMWYDAPIAWAAENGIVLGYGDGTFGPNDYITREQLCAILWRVAKGVGLNVDCDDVLSQYPDAGDVTDYNEAFAVAQVNWAVANNLLLPDPITNELNPTAKETTRAEAVVFFYNFYQTYFLAPTK